MQHDREHEMRTVTEPATSRISIVIPTYQRAHLIPTVVHPLLLDPAVAEVVIVDDGSNDATPTVCADLARSDPRILAIRQENSGEAAARAAGARAATNEFVLFFDDDVVATPSTASGHLAHHKRSSRPLVVLGYMPPRLPYPRSPGDFPIFVYGRDYEGACRKYDADPSYVLSDLWGGNFSVRKEIFLAADAVPRELPYHQDQVLGWSLRELGCTGLFDRTLQSVHHYERTPDQFFVDCRRRGQALAMLKAVSPADVETDPRAGLSAMSRAVVQAALDGPRQGTTLLNSLLHWAGRLQLWKIETRIGRLLRQIESYRSFAEYSPDPTA
jgi:GT2 family glycosyltransferase